MFVELWQLWLIFVIIGGLGGYIALGYREVARLRAGIRYHRDQQWDDRCWVDDVRLYELLPEGPNKGYDSTLPPRDVFLANCARFHDTRQVPPGCKFRKDW
jgi:hypothetical protein